MLSIIEAELLVNHSSENNAISNIDERMVILQRQLSELQRFKEPIKGVDDKLKNNLEATKDDISENIEKLEEIKAKIITKITAENLRKEVDRSLQQFEHEYVLRNDIEDAVLTAMHEQTADDAEVEPDYEFIEALLDPQNSLCLTTQVLQYRQHLERWRQSVARALAVASRLRYINFKFSKDADAALITLFYKKLNGKLKQDDVLHLQKVINNAGDFNLFISKLVESVSKIWAKQNPTEAVTAQTVMQQLFGSSQDEALDGLRQGLAQYLFTNEVVDDKHEHIVRGLDLVNRRETIIQECFKRLYLDVDSHLLLRAYHELQQLGRFSLADETAKQLQERKCQLTSLLATATQRQDGIALQVTLDAIEECLTYEGSLYLLVSSRFMAKTSLLKGLEKYLKAQKVLPLSNETMARLVSDDSATQRYQAILAQYPGRELLLKKIFHIIRKFSPYDYFLLLNNEHDRLRGYDTKRTLSRIAEHYQQAGMQNLLALPSLETTPHTVV